MPSRRSVPAIFPVSIVEPAQSRTSSAIWKATPSATPYSPEPPPSAAGRLEERAGLQGAALDVGLDRRRRVVRLRALERLAAREPQGRVGERRDRLGVAGRGELGERARKEVVAGRAGRICAVDRPGGRLAAPEVRAVDQVVVDERRHVHELDRDAGGERRLVARAASRGRRAAAAAACRRRRAPRCRRPRRGRDGSRRCARAAPRARRGTPRARRPRGSPRARSPRLLRRATRRCRRRRCGTGRRRSRGARAARRARPGSGKRRTLAGRYVYAEPPGSTLPSSGTTWSNQTR